MENKKGLCIVVIVALLVILIVIVSISALSMNKSTEQGGNTNNDKIQENVGVKEEVRAINEDEKNDLMNIIDGLNEIDENVIEVSANNPLSDEIILKIAFAKAAQGANFVSLETVNLYANKYFDKDVVPKNIPCDLGDLDLYLYDDSMEGFVYNENHLGHGGISRNIFNKFESGTLKGDVYSITVYKAFSNLTEFYATKLYPTLEDACDGTNLLWDASDEDPDDVDLKSVFDSMDVSKLKKFTYTFEKKNGNYILKSYKMN